MNPILAAPAKARPYTCYGTEFGLWIQTSATRPTSIDGVGSSIPRVWSTLRHPMGPPSTPMSARVPALAPRQSSAHVCRSALSTHACEHAYALCDRCDCSAQHVSTNYPTRCWSNHSTFRWMHNLAIIRRRRFRVSVGRPSCNLGMISPRGS